MAESAYDIQRRILAAFGLPDAQDVIDVINQGAIDNDSDDIIASRLQETATWKQRFAGNEQLRAAGLPVLSIPEYLEQERSYARVLHNAGLPAGFYDDPSDFAGFIGKSVSVGELQDRVNIASDIVSREDPSVLDQLALRGVTSGQLVAHALDPDRAAPLIKREQNSILVGAAAQRAGVGLGVGRADSLAERGIGEAQAIQGFGQINEYLGSIEKLGDIYGDDFGLEDAIAETFDGGSGEKRRRLASTERANFGGSAGLRASRRDTSGSY